MQIGGKRCVSWRFIKVEHLTNSQNFQIKIKNIVESKTVLPIMSAKIVLFFQYNIFDYLYAQPWID